jgi:hypothetical protein
MLARWQAMKRTRCPRLWRTDTIAAFSAVAFALLIVVAFATLPSPLYGLYRVRDHLSTSMVTVVYAVFAGGTTALLAGFTTCGRQREELRGIPVCTSCRGCRGSAATGMSGGYGSLVAVSSKW